MKLPVIFENEMKMLLGDEYDAFLNSYDHTPHNGLRVNTGKISPEDFLKRAPFQLHPVKWIENGFTYQNDNV